MKAPVPRGVWVGLCVAVAIDTLVQLCWKSAVLRAEAQLPQTASVFHHLLTTWLSPLFLLTVVLFVAQFINWMLILAKADLSYAQPITALSYALVSAFSAVLFNEHLPPARIAGIALILLGVWCVSGTAHHTLVPAPLHVPLPDLTEPEDDA